MPASLQTKTLTLTPSTKEETLAAIDAMSPEDRAQVSPVWLATAQAATSDDPWMHGFGVVHRETGRAVGRCAFKGPPSSDGVVEIAYGIDPEHQSKGYATEAADALTNFAFTQGVRTVCAHTLPETNASTRVLSKCGFRHVGQVIDPEDGPVWRWEKQQ
jgi:RimJ/RimL family protein N-acetyltransferase